jgi:hypothetical protein
MSFVKTKEITSAAIEAPDAGIPNFASPKIE